MKGKIFVTSSGYDPEKGKKVKDPYVGPNPSLGACRPDIREQLQKGDHIYVVSGKVPNVAQFVMGRFEIAEKISEFARRIQNYVVGTNPIALLTSEEVEK